MKNKDKTKKAITIADICLSLLFSLAWLTISILNRKWKAESAAIGEQQWHGWLGLSTGVSAQYWVIWIKIGIIVIIGIPNLVLHILCTINAKPFENRAPFILLILGFFLPFCQIIGLSILLNLQIKTQQNVKSKKDDASDEWVEEQIEEEINSNNEDSIKDSK